MRRYITAVVLLAVLAAGAGCGRRLSPLEKRWIQLHSSGGHLRDTHIWRPEVDLDLYDDIILADYAWQDLLDQPLDKVVPFLIERIPMTNTVSVKVATWGETTEGALAVYVLQHKLHDNWLEAPGRFPLLNKYAGIEGSQTMNITPFMLGDPLAIKEAIAFFTDRWEKGVKEVAVEEDLDDF